MKVILDTIRISSFCGNKQNFVVVGILIIFQTRFLGQMVGAALPALALGCSPSPIQATAALLPSHFSYCFANTVQVLLSRQLLHHTSSAALVWIVLQQAFLQLLLCNTNCNCTAQVLSRQLFCFHTSMLCNYCSALHRFPPKTLCIGTIVLHCNPHKEVN